MEHKKEDRILKYSIIVPVYRCEDFLVDCIESLLNQTYNGDYEILLIDDGSLDKSGIIADRLMEKYPQIRAFHKKNGGAASARNRGIEESRGEYLLFIDGDDTVDAELLATIDEKLKGNSQALIVFGMSFDYYLDGILNRSEKLSCKHSGEYSLGQLLESYQNFFEDNALSSACNKVFLSDIIKQNHLRFREGMTLYEDYDFVLQYLLYVNSIICLNSAFYHYRNNLEDAHLKHRVSDLVKLRNNMATLLESSINFCKEKRSLEHNKQILDVSANLYMRLLIQNLINQKHEISKIGNDLTDYCAEEKFRMVLAYGGKMSNYEQKLLNQVDCRKFKKIYFEFQKRIIILNIKKWLKRILKK